MHNLYIYDILYVFIFGHVDESPWLRFEFIPIFLEMQRYLMNRKSETNAATSLIWSSQLLRLFSGTSLAYYTLLSCELHTYASYCTLQCCSCWMKVTVKDPTMKRFFGRRMQETCCHVFVCWRRRNKHWQGGKKCIPTIPWKKCRSKEMLRTGYNLPWRQGIPLNKTQYSMFLQDKNTMRKGAVHPLLELCLPLISLVWPFLFCFFDEVEVTE